MAIRALFYILLAHALTVFLMFFPNTTAAAVTNINYNAGSGKWLMRGMLLDVRQSHTQSNLGLIGGNIKTDKKRTFGLDISYFLTNEFSVEFQGGVFSRNYYIENSKIGSFKVGTVESNSLSLVLQYHFNTCCNLIPYLGAGMNHSWTRSVKPANGIPKFDVNELNSIVISSGIDYRMSEDLFLSTSVRYIMSPDYYFTGAGFNAKVKMNTVITGFGVAYKF